MTLQQLNPDLLKPLTNGPTVVKFKKWSDQDYKDHDQELISEMKEEMVAARNGKPLEE